MAALLLSSCAVEIKDETWCSPITITNPDGTLQRLGAACDNFLTSNQQVLTEPEWEALQAKWGVSECTPETTLGDIKGELEKLCSKTPCTYEQAQQVKQAVAMIDRMLSSNKEMHSRVAP